ncbi:MAG TPA: metallophosphoesterase family protein [Gaiella sp.]|jgi:predicted phosphodiesterase|nr:metallophosphoesterase family protein [Gaiella sp.]
MRVAALYDVHGILPALEAVLADPRCAAADVIVCGGDLVAGPLPMECLERLEADGRVRFLEGNGDRETVSPPAESPLAEIGRWAADRLGPTRLERVAAWPATVELEVPGLGRVLFCHATPSSDTDILTSATPEPDVAAELEGLDADVVVCGHTHVQYDRRIGRTRLVNVGSVGMPYEGAPDARWALLGDGEVALVSTSYDAEAALSALRETEFPMLEEWYGSVVRAEVTAEQATAIFEGRRLGA